MLGLSQPASAEQQCRCTESGWEHSHGHSRRTLALWQEPRQSRAGPSAPSALAASPAQGNKGRGRDAAGSSALPHCIQPSPLPLHRPRCSSAGAGLSSPHIPSTYTDGETEAATHLSTASTLSQPLSREESLPALTHTFLHPIQEAKETASHKIKSKPAGENRPTEHEGISSAKHPENEELSARTRGYSHDIFSSITQG